MALVDPTALTWAQNAGAVHTARMMRLASGGSVRGDSALGNNLSGRSGVCWRATGNSMGCAQIGGGSMSLNFNPGLAYVAGTEALSQGGYWIANDANISIGPFATAHATLNRIDLVYLQVRDSFYSTAFNDARVLIQTGVAGAGVPAITGNPPNTLIIAQVTVRAGATSILQSDVLYVAPILTAPGGIAPLWASHATIAGNIDGEFSFYNKLLRRWDAAAAAWRAYGIPYVATDTDHTNPDTNQPHYNTTLGQFMRWTGSAWAQWAPNILRFAAVKSATQIIATNAWTPISFNVEQKDTGNGHSTVTNNTRYTAPRTGSWEFVVGGQFSDDTGDRGFALRVNGAAPYELGTVTLGPATSAGGVSWSGRTSAQLELIAGDYVEAVCWQNASNSITLEHSRFEAKFLGSD
jgi:hypothetical protein